MSLDTLRNHAAGLVKAVDVKGNSYHLRKFSAKSYMEFMAAREAMPSDIGVYVLLVSKSLCDAEGVLDCDTDEGRELLSRLPVDDIRELGEAAIEWAIGRKVDEPKNSPPLSSSDSSSA
jgi:hypothetical protein